MSIERFEQRDVGFPLEVRNAETMVEERMMRLLLVPYGETSYLTKYQHGERFLKGAFRKAAAEFRGRRTPLYLFRSHNHDRAIGRATALTDTAEGPVGDFKIPQTAAGDEAIEEYREGLLSAVSIGFRAVADSVSRVDSAREVREAAILEASLLPIGAYDGAKVLEYREPPDLSGYLPPPPPVVDLSLPWGRRNRVL